MNKITLLISVYALVSLTACTSKKKKKSEEGKFTITSPLVMDTSFTKEYVAQIQSLQNIEIRAMVKGYIESINVDEGQHVMQDKFFFNMMPQRI